MQFDWKWCRDSSANRSIIKDNYNPVAHRKGKLTEVSAVFRPSVPGGISPGCLVFGGWSEPLDRFVSSAIGVRFVTPEKQVYVI